MRWLACGAGLGQKAARRSVRLRAPGRLGSRESGKEDEMRMTDDQVTRFFEIAAQAVQDEDAFLRNGSITIIKRMGIMAAITTGCCGWTSPLLFTSSTAVC